MACLSNVYEVNTNVGGFEKAFNDGVLI